MYERNDAVRSEEMKTLPVTKPSLLERGCECGVNLIFGPRLRVSKNARRARAETGVSTDESRLVERLEGAVGPFRF